MAAMQQASRPLPSTCGNWRSSLHLDTTALSTTSCSTATRYPYLQRPASLALGRTRQQTHATALSSSNLQEGGSLTSTDRAPALAPPPARPTTLQAPPVRRPPAPIPPTQPGSPGATAQTGTSGGSRAGLPVSPPSSSQQTANSASGAGLAPTPPPGEEHTLSTSEFDSFPQSFLDDDPRSKRQRFRFTVSRTSSVDLFAPLPPVVQQGTRSPQGMPSELLEPPPSPPRQHGRQQWQQHQGSDPYEQRQQPQQRVEQYGQQRQQQGTAEAQRQGRSRQHLGGDARGRAVQMQGAAQLASPSEHHPQEQQGQHGHQHLMREQQADTPHNRTASPAQQYTPAPFTVHLEAPRHLQATTLHVHCSSDGGHTWWSRPLLSNRPPKPPGPGPGSVYGRGQPILTAHLQPPRRKIPTDFHQSNGPSLSRSGPGEAMGSEDLRGTARAAGAAGEAGLRQSPASSTQAAAHMKQTRGRQGPDQSAGGSVQWVLLYVADQPCQGHSMAPRGINMCELQQPGSYSLELQEPAAMQQWHQRRQQDRESQQRQGSGSAHAGRPGVTSQAAPAPAATQDCHTLPQRQQRPGQCFAVCAARLLQRPTALAVDVSLMVGRRAHRGDEEACRTLTRVWQHSARLQPLMLIASTSRSFESYQQAMLDREHLLPEPDVLLLGSGTEVLYRTPHGWSEDQAWAQQLSHSGWQLGRVKRVVRNLISQSTPQGNGEPRRVSVPRVQSHIWRASASGGRFGDPTLMGSVVKSPEGSRLARLARQYGQHRVAGRLAEGQQQGVQRWQRQVAACSDRWVLRLPAALRRLARRRQGAALPGSTGRSSGSEGEEQEGDVNLDEAAGSRPPGGGAAHVSSALKDMGLLRVKLDTGKQQGPFRVRLLVKGGFQAAQTFAQALNAALTIEAGRLAFRQRRLARRNGQQQARAAQGQQQGRQGTPLSSLAASDASRLAYSRGEPTTAASRESSASTAPMRWSLITHCHAEGAGGTHRGWAAIDIVPRCAGPSGALVHVAQRFGLRGSVLAACVEPSGDADAVAGFCTSSGGSAVAVGRPESNPALVQATARSLAPAVGALSAASRVHGSRGKRSASSCRFTLKQGPAGVLEGLKVLGCYEGHGFSNAGAS